MTMPDTKSGRERKGRNKRAQLREQLYEEEMDAVEPEEEDLPPLEGEGEFVAEELPDD